MAGDGSSAVWMPSLQARISMVARRTMTISSFADGYTLTDYLTFDTTNPTSIVFCLTATRENARQVRDAISNGIWSSLNRAYLRLRDTDLVDIWSREPVMLYRDIVEAVQLFDGVCASSLRRDAGWHFMRIGRFIERAQLVSSLLEAHCANVKDTAEEDGDWAGLLRVCNAFEAYCQLHGAQGRERKGAGLSGVRCRVVLFTAFRSQSDPGQPGGH